MRALRVLLTTHLCHQHIVIPNHPPLTTTTIGKEITGKVVVTISRGRVVWEGGRLAVRPGTSRYVPLPTGGALFAGAERRAAAAWEVPYGETPVRRVGDKSGSGGGGGGEEEEGAERRRRRRREEEDEAEGEEDGGGASEAAGEEEEEEAEDAVFVEDAKEEL